MLCCSCGGNVGSNGLCSVCGKKMCPNCGIDLKEAPDCIVCGWKPGQLPQHAD